MEAVITALTSTLNGAALWGALTPMVPLIGGVGLFSLGLYFTRRLVRGAAKGKVKF